MIFHALKSSCSKLRRDEGPLEVQSLPERLVLLCKVPKGEEASSLVIPQSFRRNWQCKWVNQSVSKRLE